MLHTISQKKLKIVIVFFFFKKFAEKCKSFTEENSKLFWKKKFFAQSTGNFTLGCDKLELRRANLVKLLPVDVTIIFLFQQHREKWKSWKKYTFTISTKQHSAISTTKKPRNTNSIKLLKSLCKKSSPTAFSAFR